MKETNFLNRYPSLFLRFIFYLLLSITFCFLYFHKFITDQDFYETGWKSGIVTVLTFKAPQYAQFRLLLPLVFKIVSIVTHLSNKGVFFVLIIAQTFLILEIFYRILNEYFIDKTVNSLVAALILYPMVWNFTILNDYSLYYDFTSMLLILIAFLCILKGKNLWMIVIFIIGNFNHDSIGFVIVMYLLYNYKRLFKKETIIYTFLLSFIFIALKVAFHFLFISNPSEPFWFRAPRNVEIFYKTPPYYLIRDFLLFFGALHLFILLNIKRIWNQMPSGKLFISLTLIPYLIVMFMLHNFDEARDYVVAIPFIIIPFMIYLSTFPNSILKRAETG
jgi:hypothetical protein